MSLSCAVELLSDEFHKRFWSEETYRHVKLRITVFHEGESTGETVEFELLVPEELVQDLSGDNWRPLERQEVNGTVYYAWSDFGQGSIGGGLIFRGDGHFSYTLGVNLKAYTASVTVLYRLDQRTNPISDFQSQKIDLTPYRPSL